MIVHDPIYGQFRLPHQLLELVRTPEVRRLSQIRLLNTLTPTLPTLGDLRRYSHTLGVVHLAHINGQPGYSAQERSAFAASVILHDIGTPPFGHLMEYHLKERHQWSHENVIHAMLWGFHAPENRAHQIFAGRAMSVRAVIRRARLSLELIEAIITRKHPLAHLLFGTLDLDNLDNVVRMAWALGLRFETSIASKIAHSLGVSRDGTLQLSQCLRTLVEQWSELRRKVYEILIFDGATVAAQAVLSEAIEIGLELGLLSENDWALYDETLLERLRAHETTKQMVARQYLGELPSLIYAVQVVGDLWDYGLKNRADAKSLLDQVLAERFGENKCLAYVFVDRGSFEKRLDFIDPESLEAWTIGMMSRSFVLYAFCRRGKIPIPEAAAAAETLAARIGASDTNIMRSVISDSREDAWADDQPQLTLPAF
jgi:HD superfamily phosphohydrolase